MCVCVCVCVCACVRVCVCVCTRVCTRAAQCVAEQSRVGCLADNLVWRVVRLQVQHQGTAAAKDPAGAKAAAANSTMLSGIGMTRATLAKALAKENVQRMDTDEILGHPLDPELHEAVATVPLSATDGAAPNVVVDVVRSGYLIDGKLLRAPRVVVSQEA